MNRNTGIKIAISIGSLISTSMLMASAPSPEKQRAEAFLQAYHPRLGEGSSVQRLPQHSAQMILQYATPTDLNITLVNAQIKPLFIKIWRIIHGQKPKGCPVAWEGNLASNISVAQGQDVQNYAQVTLPIQSLKIGIGNNGQTAYYITLTKEILQELNNSNIVILAIEEFSLPRYDRQGIMCLPAHCRLTGWKELNPGNHAQVWTNEVTASMRFK